MKKIVALLLILTLALSLTACGRSGKTGSPAPQQEETSFGLDLATGEWTGRGGSYILREADLPAEEDICQILLWQGELYRITNENYERFTLRRGEETLCTMAHYPQAAAVSEKGFWILENNYYDGKNHYIVSHISPEGEGLGSLSISDIYGDQTFPKALGVCGGELYISTLDDELFILSEEGRPRCSMDLPGESSLLTGGDGQVYVAVRTESGNELYRPDPDTASLERLFSCGPGHICRGGEGHFLLLLADDGLYSLGNDGGTEPVAIWAECGISSGGLAGVRPLPNGRFLCAMMWNYQVLEPVEPGQIHPRTRLTVAQLGVGYMEKFTGLFNALNENYYVDILDYTDGGAMDEQTALQRLNAEIISGRAPDMVCFDFVDPHAFISKGLLLDMRPLFERDEEISLSDIAVLDALDHYGGLYTMGAFFTVSTVVGRYADFGERCGWTTEEYLAIDSARGTAETLYNMTRDLFIYDVVAPYAQQAIDWQTGECRFDTPAFITLLDAARRMRETPEDPNNMDFTPGPVRVGAGTLVGASVFVDGVSALAQAERQAGCKLSFIGMPTADGGSGGHFLAMDPSVGIMSQGEHQEGCWEFIKCMLMTNSSGLSVYRPLLEERIEAAKASEDPDKRISNEDAQRLLDFIAALKQEQFSDRTVTGIIREECAAMFAGDKTPEETARLIQSRVSLYVAEQR